MIQKDKIAYWQFSIWFLSFI